MAARCRGPHSDSSGARDCGYCNAKPFSSREMEHMGWRRLETMVMQIL